MSLGRVCPISTFLVETAEMLKVCDHSIVKANPTPAFSASQCSSDQWVRRREPSSCDCSENFGLSSQFFWWLVQSEDWFLFYCYCDQFL